MASFAQPHHGPHLSAGVTAFFTWWLKARVLSTTTSAMSMPSTDPTTASTFGCLISGEDCRHRRSSARQAAQAKIPDSEGAEVWALYDHDGRQDIDQVCARARRQGIQAALSHPSFELWLLLHFQDFSPAAQNGSNNVILEKLRAAHSEFAGFGDGSKRIDERRFAALVENDGIRRAVERSRRLLGNLTSQPQVAEIHRLKSTHLSRNSASCPD